MQEFDRALLIFVVGALVTALTAAMVIKGHLHWRGRDPWEQN